MLKIYQKYYIDSNNYLFIMMYYELVNTITIFNITQNESDVDKNNIFIKNFSDISVNDCKWFKCDTRLSSITCDGINFINVQNISYINKKYIEFQVFEKYILFKYNLYYSIHKTEYGTEQSFIKKYNFDINRYYFK